ncbi:hypothetical protein [Ferrimonas lipolytica]|uniref:Peptidase MA superfamily protein n=1 Tax=Ferrimonas lipolytica TaxID=2724191 RepID=A0A6H1UGI4_9GAMM|nr:hypothetical protein [Ferrimonas lipolytica]QIZ77739.1 hypothetical protein HER31_13030 [Ferrimonas lipolytica]
MLLWPAALLALLPSLGQAIPAHQMCRLDQLQQCQLSLEWQQVLTQLWPGDYYGSMRRAVKGQGGVTLLAEHDALILLNPTTLQRNHLVLLDETLYERPSLRNYRSTYYHEIGHVATQHSHWLARLQPHNWPQHWNREVLADLYLYWHLLREGADEQELWAQLHLRNIGLIQAQPDWQHWTTPVLYPLLQDFGALKQWSKRPLEQFIDAALADYDLSPLQDYRQLGQRQFGLTRPSVAQPYLGEPHRQQWADMLTPTLIWLGVDLSTYLRRHQL